LTGSNNPHDHRPARRCRPAGRLPDLVFRNRQEFLDLIAQPRPFTDLALLNVTVRIVGDVALLHGRVTYTTKDDGQQREALYTDTYQRREQGWMCIAGEVVAKGE
jgi:ketosteroid isomerase-like protein